MKLTREQFLKRMAAGRAKAAKRRASSHHERQAARYTHSPWSGKRYAKQQTAASLAAESMAILKRHPGFTRASGKASAEWLAAYKKKYGINPKARKKNPSGPSATDQAVFREIERRIGREIPDREFADEAIEQFMSDSVNRYFRRPLSYMEVVAAADMAVKLARKARTSNPRRRPPHGGMEHFTPRSSRRIPKESSEAVMLRALNAGRRAKRAKLPAAIKLLHAELKSKYGKGLGREQVAALRDRRRYVEALAMLDDMEARMGVSGFVRGEVADALRERAENPRKRRTPARKPRRVNPATKGFVLRAQRAGGPLLSYDGERFSNNAAPYYFATQAQAVTFGRKLIRKYTVIARQGYVLSVHLEAGRVGRKLNPAPRNSAAVEQAAQKFRDFTGMEPGKILKVRQLVPKTGLVIGKLDGVLYTTIRDGKRERYKHAFRDKSRPLLSVSSDGSQLIIVGGRYEFTEAGIEDR